MPPRLQTYDPLDVPEAGPPLSEPADADLFLFVYGSHAPERGYGHLMVTSLTDEAGATALWHAVDAAWRYSQASFVLMQRLAVAGPQGRWQARTPRAPQVEAFFRACPYYTLSPVAREDALVLLTLDPQARTLGLDEAGELPTSPSRVRLQRALERSQAPLRVAARRVGSLFWHIHM